MDGEDSGSAKDGDDRETMAFPRGLTEHVMIFGIPKRVAVVILIPAATIGLGGQQTLPAIIILVVSFAIARFATAADPEWFWILRRLMKHRKQSLVP